MDSKVHTDVDRLDRLIKDLRSVLEGDKKKIDLGSDVPILKSYRVTTRRTACLEGIVYGHPTLPDGETILTSELHVFLEQEALLYARTLSRWYRLDVPADTRQRG